MYKDFYQIELFCFQAGDLYEKIRDYQRAMECFKKGKDYRRGENCVKVKVKYHKIQCILFDDPFLMPCHFYINEDSDMGSFV